MGHLPGALAVTATPASAAPPLSAGWLQPIATTLRWGTIAIGSALLLLGRRPVGTSVLVAGGVVLAALTVARTSARLRATAVAADTALVIEVAIALVAVIATGGWSSPFAVYLAAPLLLVGVEGGLARALQTVAGITVAFILRELLDPTSAQLQDAGQTLTVMLAAGAAGYVARRALLQAEEEHERTLGRVQQLGHVNAMLSTLHDLVRTMPAPLTVDEIVGVIRRQLDELFDAGAVVLLLADGGGRRWRPVYAEGIRLNDDLGEEDLPAPVRARGPHQRPVVVDELAPGEGLWSEARSGAYLWLWLRGQPSGLLVLEHDHPRGTLTDQHDTLERLSVPLALAIDNAVWFTRLRTIGAEEERQRIGAALHDRFAQSLVYIAMSLDRTVGQHPDDPDLARLRTDVRDTLADLRETLRELRLRVTEEHDLVAVLTDHLDRFGARFGVVTRLEVRGDPVRPALPVEQQLLRIVQDLFEPRPAGGGCDDDLGDLRDGAGVAAYRRVRRRAGGRRAGPRHRGGRADRGGPGARGRRRRDRRGHDRDRRGNRGAGDGARAHVTRVLLVDDHRLVREGLRRTLEDAGFEVVGEAADGADGIEQAERLRPHVILMDVSMPVVDGLTATRRLRSRAPDSAVVILTMHADAELAERARTAGAAGYLVKDASGDEVAEAVRRAARGQQVVAPVAGPAAAATAEDAETRAGGDAAGSLTSREVQILQMLADGCTPQETAERLFISPKTVRNHLTKVYDKLGVNSRSQAIVEALKFGLIDLPS